MFRSNEELFQATRDLISVLERGGHTAMAARLKDGFHQLNGMTDGWAEFLKSAQDVQKNTAGRLSQADSDILDGICSGAYFAVYRRNPD